MSKDKHVHEWYVFSTALKTREIMVFCECGAFGTVPKNTKEEWALAYYAPSCPFRWADDNRVVFKPGLTTGIHHKYGVRTVVKG